MPRLSRVKIGLAALVIPVIAMPCAAGSGTASPAKASPAKATPESKGVTVACAIDPRASWSSATEVHSRLRERGLALVQIRLGEGRCYFVQARDRFGVVLSLVMHPVTSEIVRW
jgi:hypothetical protein